MHRTTIDCFSLQKSIKRNKCTSYCQNSIFVPFTAGHDITLQDPESVEITSGKLSLSYITIYEITNPKRGTWTLTVPGSNGDHEFSVKTSSDTNVDFEHYFLIALSWRRGHNADVPISNPVTGKSVTFTVSKNYYMATIVRAL